MVAMCRVAPQIDTNEFADRDPAADHAPEGIDPAAAAFARPVNSRPDKAQAPGGSADLGGTMTRHLFPDADTLVEMTAAAEVVCGVRVVQTDEPVVILSLALTAVPAEGTPVTLRWPAGPRGRYMQSGTVVGVDENRVAVELTGATGVEQQRNFVRGGGGEEVLLVRPGQPDTPGWIRDISEQSVRAHFADVEVHDGDQIVLRILLDPEVVELDAVAAKVGTLRQSIPRHGPLSVEVVAVYTATETQAKVIRRYVLRQQSLHRARMVIG
jgi:hypothetical protein